MKTRKDNIAILCLDERRYAVAVDGVVRYIGTEEECKPRVKILDRTDDRAVQDQALGRLGRLMR